MHITIEIHEGVRRTRPRGPRTTRLELPAGATVRDAVVQAGVDPWQPWNAAVGGRLAGSAEPLCEGASVIVFAAIEGG